LFFYSLFLEISKVIQAFSVACAILGRTEILNIVIPVEDKSLMEIKRLRHAPSEFGPSAFDAVDVILVEKDDRVPMLLDMNVNEIRFRMKRERLGKQIFLPRNYDYQKSNLRKRVGVSGDESIDISTGIDATSTTAAGDVELIDIHGAAI
jgi:hypothetical protein